MTEKFSILDKFTSIVYNLSKKEKKLLIYNGYRENRLLNWKKKSSLNWKTTLKIVDNLKIITALEIRDFIREFVEQNPQIFEQDNVYITSFGQKGKSGDVILYEFTHCVSKKLQNKVIESWEIQNLPEGSKVVFLDDIVGTGRQSVEYINDKLNLIIQPSFKCYLFCICATQGGIEKFNSETNFEMVHAMLLSEDSEFLNPNNKIFNEKEKQILIDLNQNLTPRKNNDYSKGLLVAFPYGIPNNTMPIIWKDNFKYKCDDQEMSWYALLPRKF
ncbi:phosphoribosyltransferase-like protein [Bacillus cereus]|uniref:phosphoribosyltransferase-like protein n=1 Tax=Bacillus cereus TaxID=1396 RepID=UPI000BFA3EBE|nr:hypothetical protein [Bacillus cereus]PFU24527.1 hypothetical protein COK76_15510 [Bacillus cereus]HDR7890831.1 hypothetical protein [Bacillus toyonensis]